MILSFVFLRMAVVNLEFYLFECRVRAPGGSDFDFIYLQK